MVFMLLAMFSGCKSNVETPTVSPNVPVVSESPAITSPSIGSPEATANVESSASPEASPEASK